MSEKPNILLVDDIPANLHTLSSALAGEYDLTIATSGVAALSLAEQHPPDLILLDVMMPGMDGLETLHRIRTSDWGHSIPVILVTADDCVETHVKGLEMGAYDFITKPVVVPIVLARVRHALERHHLQQELFKKAFSDELTGVLNRRAFLLKGDAEYQRVQRYATPCGLLMLDLDHFKSINDRYGHGVGDWVLKHFSQTISMQLRGADLFGRIGGEEFGLLLPQTDEEGTLLMAERLRSGTEQAPLLLSEATGITVTVSVGVTALSAKDQVFGDALRRADKALYTAKSGGRNCVKVA